MNTALFTFPGYRIGLRPISLEDVDAIMGWINDPDVTRNFAGMSKVITRDEEIAFLETMIASENDSLHAIVDESGTYLGNAGIHKIYWPARNGRLGVVIGSTAAQGKGLGQEALKLITAYGFMRLNLHKIWVIHYRENARMHHIMKKLGFVEEGVLRDEYFNADVFHDMIRHSLLEGEFDDRRVTWRI